LALGAQKIGLARPFLQAAILDAAADTGKIHLNQLVERLQRELEIAMFCSGVREVKRFRIEKKWKLKRT
jgi:isopentenyl diphosphate isomerase/L-lactate dehydrogenase-like FMN-dependent dehydrogenase